MRKHIAALAFGLATLAGVARAQSIPTAFTYQGELSSGSSVASGLHDLRFRLFDAANGGVQVGATLCADNVTVVSGRFAVSLDFGASAFTNRPLFLEVEVRADAGLDCSNSAGFTVLGPRQPLTPTPYARMSADSVLFNGQPPSFYFNASNVTSGTLSDARLSSNVPRFNTGGTFTGNLSFSGSTQFTSASFQAATFTAASGTFTGSFSGGGSGLTSLNASNIASGTLADARLSTNIPKLNAASSTFTGNVTVGGTFQAQTINYESPVLRRYVVSPGELIGGLLAGYTDPQTAVNASLATSATSGAAVHLPDGAVVTAMRVFGTDDASNDMTVSLIRRPLDGGAGGTMASITTGTNAAGIRTFSDTTISGATVDNSLNQYILRVSIEATSIGTIEFRGAVIEYTVSQPLP